MQGKAFFDTNVFLYQFDPREPQKQAIALQMLREAMLMGAASISYQVVQEFIAVAIRREFVNFSEIEIEEYLQRFLLPIWKVWPSEELYALAMQTAKRYHIGFYDALIVAAAILDGCATLVTQDLQDGMVFDSVKVHNPFTALK